METRFWFSKNLRLIVSKLDEPANGKQFAVTDLEGTPYPNAGLLIKGCPNFWEHCLTKEQFDARVASYKYSRTPEYKKLQQQRKANQLAKQHATAIEELARLQEDCEVIPATYANIAVVLRYLNSQNWGSWILPKMDIGYVANQHDCGGKTATTITLEHPIQIDGEPCQKFVIGAPAGYLMKYHRVK